MLAHFGGIDAQESKAEQREQRMGEDRLQQRGKRRHRDADEDRGRDRARALPAEPGERCGQRIERHSENSGGMTIWCKPGRAHAAYQPCLAPSIADAIWWFCIYEIPHE